MPQEPQYKTNDPSDPAFWDKPTAPTQAGGSTALDSSTRSKADGAPAYIPPVPGLMQGIGINPSALGQRLWGAAKATGKDMLNGSVVPIGHRTLQAVHLAPQGDLYSGEPTGKQLPPAMIQTFMAAGGLDTPTPEEAPVRGVNVKGPGEITPEMPRPRAYTAQPNTTPIPPRTGLALPGEVAPTPYDPVAPYLRAKIGNAPTPDPYANVDQLRSGLALKNSSSLGEASNPAGFFSQPSSATGEALATLGQPAGEKAALAKFKGSNPSALGNIRGVDAKTASAPERVADARAVAPVESPKAKPVSAKPAPSAAERRSGYLFGEHASEYDPDNLAHRKIKDMTHDELVDAANSRALRGKTDWTKADVARTTASHGKSSNPNASYIRGELLKEANMPSVGGGSGAPDINPFGETSGARGTIVSDPHMAEAERNLRGRIDEIGRKYPAKPIKPITDPFTGRPYKGGK